MQQAAGVPCVVAAGSLADKATLKVSIVLASGERVGPGKAALLEGIRDTGSISAATRGMGMATSAPGCCSTPAACGASLPPWP
jgi:hypothetical protein